MFGGWLKAYKQWLDVPLGPQTTQLGRYRGTPCTLYVGPDLNSGLYIVWKEGGEVKFIK